MIRSETPGVKGAARPKSQTPRQISFAFRADPVALDDLKLPARARAAFVLILDNARSRGGTCRLSNTTMGKVLGCCTMTIKRALATLEAAHLVRRETAAEGRIRTGIVVTWDGVGTCSTERMALEHPRSRGGTSPFQGVEHRCSTNQSPIQSEISDGGGSPSIEGREAADYLRRCVAAAKRGEPMPEPPTPSAEPSPPAAASVVESPRPTPRVEAIEPMPVKAPAPLPGVALAEVGRLVRSLAEDVKSETAGRWNGRQSADVQSRRWDAYRRDRTARSNLDRRSVGLSVASPVQVGPKAEVPLISPPSSADLRSGMGSPSAPLRTDLGGRDAAWKSSRS